MIVDSSAVVAIIRGEPEASRLLNALRESDRLRMSAANYLESGIVADRSSDPVVSVRLDELMNEVGMELAEVTADQARSARDAYRHFGKGSGHPAQLNFGDCFAYALAVETGEPLLYKGDDFTHAGVRSALDA